jgi:hypothetical protein
MTQRNIFGWSLPPGVSNRMIDDQCDDGTTQLQSDILTRLEAADIPREYCDKIMLLVALGETARQDIDDARSIDRLAYEAETPPTCAICGETELYCQCTQFDTERK